MRACGDQDGDVLGPDLRHLLEERLSISRRGCARVMSQTEIAIRWPARTCSRSGGQSMRRPDRGEQRRVRIGGRGSWDRLDDGDAFVGKVDLETIRSVVQSYSHSVSVGGSW